MTEFYHQKNDREDDPIWEPTASEYLALISGEEGFELLMLVSTPEELLNQFPGEVKKINLTKGDVICKEGDEQNYVYFINEGEVLIDNTFTISAPEMFGEMGAYLQQRTKDVVANTELELIAVPSYLFFKSLDSGQMEYLTRRVQRYAVNDLRVNTTDEISDQDLDAFYKLKSKDKYEMEVLDHILDAIKENNWENRLRTRTLSPYEIIFREGDITKDLAVVLQGELYVLTGELDKQERKTFKRESGSLLGEGASLNVSGSRKAAVIGSEKGSKVIFIPSDLVKELLQLPRIRHVLTKLSLSRAKSTSNQVDEIYGLDSKTCITPSELKKSLNIEEIHKKIALYNYNAIYQPERAFETVASFNDGIVIFDRAGKLVYVNMDKAGTTNLLLLLRGLEVDNVDNLRNECLVRNPQLNSALAFTSGPIPEIRNGPDGKYAYFESDASWIKSRQALHEKLYEKSESEVRALSKRIDKGLSNLELEGPALIILKGIILLLEKLQL